MSRVRITTAGCVVGITKFVKRQRILTRRRCLSTLRRYYFCASRYLITVCFLKNISTDTSFEAFLNTYKRCK